MKTPHLNKLVLSLIKEYESLLARIKSFLSSLYVPDDLHDSLYFFCVFIAATKLIFESDIG